MDLKNCCYTNWYSKISIYIGGNSHVSETNPQFVKIKVYVKGGLYIDKPFTLRV